MITHLADLTVRVVELRYRNVVERRVELVPVDGGDPLVSLTVDEGMALSMLVRRRIREATP